MYRSLCLLFSMAIPVMGLAQAARPDEVSDTAVYVVSYIEVMPPSLAEAITLLKQYREASRQDEGNMRLEVLQQRDRPNHFVCLEMWRDQPAFEAHGMAAHTTQVHEKLRPLRLSPYDERLHTGLAIGSLLAARAAGATYVVTHADAIPPAKDNAMALFKPLTEASRQETGNVRFEVLQQRNRQNHFTIVEVWQDQPALEAHVMAAQTRQFREQFQPMSGSLYDERLYKALE